MTPFKSFGTSFNPAGNYMLKVSSRNARTRCELWTYLTPCFSVFIVNFEQVNAGWEVFRYPNWLADFQGSGSCTVRLIKFLDFDKQISAICYKFIIFFTRCQHQCHRFFLFTGSSYLQTHTIPSKFSLIKFFTLSSRHLPV